MRGGKREIGRGEKLGRERELEEEDGEKSREWGERTEKMGKERKVGSGERREEFF